MAFYEPQSVYLAALGLWALSFYASRTLRGGSSGGQDEVTEESTGGIDDA